MPLAVTHVLLTIIAIDIYRDYVTKHKKYFTLYTILLGGIAGLLPDTDVPLGWIGNLIGVPINHGGITHTLFFTILFLIPAIILTAKKKHTAATIFYVISFGVFSHLFLDYVLGGGAYEGIYWFYPFSATPFKLHLLRRFGTENLPAALDAVILLAWLWHEETKHKIRDFI